MNISYNINGGKIKLAPLKDILHNSYKKKKDMTDDIHGYVLDKQLSGTRVQVYHNKDKNHTVISHRGTNSLSDIMTDARLLIGDRSGNRYKHANDISDKAHQKYKGSKFSQIGHSLGADIASNTANKDDEVIRYNGPTTTHDLLKPQSSNEYNIHTSLDPISILQPLKPFKRTDNNITIPSDNYNPLDQHKVDKLSILDTEHTIGQ